MKLEICDMHFFIEVVVKAAATSGPFGIGSAGCVMAQKENPAVFSLSGSTVHQKGAKCK
jgi:hypothetical protein